jgi:HEAT repeat protein
MRGFKDSNEEVRSAAGEAVLKMGQPSFPYLREALKDLDPSVRSRSAGLLGEFAPGSPEVISELMCLLNDSHTGVKRTAAVSLGKFGPLAKDAVASLGRLLGDSDQDMRRHAAEAIGKIKMVSDEAVASLSSTLPSEADEEVRRSIVFALGEIGSPVGLDALSHSLQDSQPHVAALAAEAIGKLGVANDACISSLIDAATRADYPLLSLNAVRTLGIIKSCRPDAIVAIQRVAENMNCSEASCAAWALGEIGSQAASALPDLRRLTSQSTDETTRRMAAEAIKKINPGGQ